MASRFNLPHIDITARSSTHRYLGDSGFGRGTPRVRAEHGRRMQAELRVALQAGAALQPTDERLPPSPGIYLEVELDRGKAADAIDLKSAGIRSGAAKIDDAYRRTISLFVPEHARPAIENIINEYLNGELTETGQPKNKTRVEAIEAIRAAHIGTRWTDQRPIPTDTQTPMWWSLWCYRDREAQIQETCTR